MVPCSVGAILLLFVPIALCIKKRNNGKKSLLKSHSTKSKTVEMNALLPKHSHRAREFPLANLRFMQELGEGAFGKYEKENPFFL